MTTFQAWIINKAKAVSIMYTYICFSSIIDWVLKFYFNIRVFPAVLSHSLFYKIEPLQEANLEWQGGIMYILLQGYFDLTILSASSSSQTEGEKWDDKDWLGTVWQFIFLFVSFNVKTKIQPK